MSYILDALKKSEAARDPNAAAALVIAKAERIQADRKKHHLVLWVIGIALLINAGVFAGWLAWWANPQATMVEARSDPLPEEKQPEETQPTEPAADLNQAAIATVAERRSVIERQSPLRQTSPPASLQRVRLNDLPASLRAGFPGLAFSTHIYADDPTLRAVVINGTRRTEGEVVEGMRLEEITEEGVVLQFGEYLVGISVLESWENDYD